MVQAATGSSTSPDLDAPPVMQDRLRGWRVRPPRRAEVTRWTVSLGAVDTTGRDAYRLRQEQATG